MRKESRRAVKRGWKKNAQWGPSHGPRHRGRVPERGEETSGTEQTEQREGEHKRMSGRQFLGKGRKRKEEQKATRLTQSSKAHPVLQVCS